MDHSSIQHASLLDDDDVLFADEPALAVEEPPPGWTVLIVDDDPQVRDVTRFALGGVTYQGLGLRLLEAASAAEAKAMLQAEPDIALTLLDVVMETDHAGLDLVRWIRQIANNRLIRIVLRTGQPGQAPERKVILEYDINDYKQKSELTSQGLYTTVIAALRTFEQLRAVDRSRQGLEKILTATSWLYDRRTMENFVEGVVYQIQALVGDARGALLCTVSNDHDLSPQTVRVLAGSAPFQARTGTPISDHLSDTDCQSIVETIRTGTPLFDQGRCIVTFRTQDRSTSAIWLSGLRRLDPVEERLIEVFVANVAAGLDKVRLFERLEHDARHDRLTGLLNRAALVQTMDAHQEDRRGEDPPDALLMLDFDRFRDIIDDLGYQGGDQFLGLMSRRLADALQPREVAARLAGDAFAVLVCGASPIASLARADEIRSAVCQPVTVADREIIPSVSIAIVSIIDGSRPAELLLSDADAVMGKAKRLGGGRTEIQDQRSPRRSKGRMGLLTDLTRAIDHNQMRLHYQPIVHADTKELAGFEALIRWQHPDRGLVMPQSFISLVEDTGLVVPMGKWALTEAVRQLADWTDRLPEARDLFVGVNVSARQFVGGDLVDFVRALLVGSRVVPSQLKLELTESLIMEDPDLANDALQELTKLGVSISLDDFGTGYSSLSYLPTFPINTLKIDRSFVNAMLSQRNTMTVMTSICGLARNLGMTTVAEGAETEAEISALQALGVDFIQGFAFGRPTPPDQAEALIRRGRI
ncbi:MAG: EAL domain-containing protein [Alphaproteobacteria bacterium]|nr:MAG: EAL domain-containing protein [Alphaproteobacteria bacterium]